MIKTSLSRLLKLKVSNFSRKPSQVSSLINFCLCQDTTNQSFWPSNVYCWETSSAGPLGNVLVAESVIRYTKNSVFVCGKVLNILM